MAFVGESSGTRTVTAEGQQSEPLTVSWYAVSDVGHQRERNEDSVVATGSIFAVADGMGGHQAGDLASAAIAERLEGVAFPVTYDAIYEALLGASGRIGEISLASGGQSGSTVTGVALARFDEGLGWLVFNIGDSRVYAFHQDRLRQITRDHSIVADMVESGQLSEEEAAVHPARNSITRAIGFNMDPTPDLWRINTPSRLVFLICSDGLTKEVPVSEMEESLTAAPTLKEAGDDLMQRALDHGGSDNVSVVLVESLVALGQ